jgi:AraC family transcriptional regulator, regulatory protein of adaptative response / methylated-DNA-[protein]-cysteine methyltransferase
VTTREKTLALAVATLQDPRWPKVLARDASCDGQFYYAVRTTGVYCRPSCAARPARPENVSFYATGALAQANGFRACKRCKPDGAAPAAQQAAMVARLCRYMEQAPTTPTLAALAAQAALSPYHLHRVFKSVTGVTPKAYAVAHRAQQLRGHLQRLDATVTDAVYDAGYQSSGPFYAKANAMLGMTPSTYRAGGKGLAVQYAVAPCALGRVLVAQSTRGVCAVLLGDEDEAMVQDLRHRLPHATLKLGDASFNRLMALVLRFIDAPRLGLNLPLDVRGTAFQQRVWQALQTIPPGQTLSYAEVAARIGSPQAVRAVAGACAANALAIVIPCHRVLRSDGTLSGYRWGVERKRALLALEAKT